jgi:hypothetical protein
LSRGDRAQARALSEESLALRRAISYEPGIAESPAAIARHSRITSSRMSIFFKMRAITLAYPLVRPTARQRQNIRAVGK